MANLVKERHELVLERAGKLILSQGYQATSMKDIAAACGLGMNAIYSTFGSKEEICAQLHLRALRAFKNSFLLAMEMDKPLPAKNRDLVQLYIDFFVRYNFLYEIVWLVLDGQLDSVLSSATVSEIHSLFKEILGKYRDLLEQLQEEEKIRTDLDPMAMAAAVWSMTSGMAATCSHGTSAITGIPDSTVREIELDMILSYLQYKQGGNRR